MQFTSYLQNGELTVALTGEIDHHFAKKYIQAIAGKIEAYTPSTCIMDSSGIAVVINSMRFMSRLGGRLFLSSLQEQPKKVFYASGLDKLVNIVEEVNEV